MLRTTKDRTVSAHTGHAARRMLITVVVTAGIVVALAARLEAQAAADEPRRPAVSFPFLRGHWRIEVADGPPPWMDGILILEKLGSIPAGPYVRLHGGSLCFRVLDDAPSDGIDSVALAQAREDCGDDHGTIEVVPSWPGVREARQWTCPPMQSFISRGSYASAVLRHLDGQFLVVGFDQPESADEDRARWSLLLRSIISGDGATPRLRDGEVRIPVCSAELVIPLGERGRSFESGTDAGLYVSFRDDRRPVAGSVSVQTFASPDELVRATELASGYGESVAVRMNGRRFRAAASAPTDSDRGNLELPLAFDCRGAQGEPTYTLVDVVFSLRRGTPGGWLADVPAIRAALSGSRLEGDVRSVRILDPWQRDMLPGSRTERIAALAWFVALVLAVAGVYLERRNG